MDLLATARQAWSVTPADLWSNTGLAVPPVHGSPRRTLTVHLQSPVLSCQPIFTPLQDPRPNRGQNPVWRVVTFPPLGPIDSTDGETSQDLGSEVKFTSGEGLTF